MLRTGLASIALSVTLVTGSSCALNQGDEDPTPTRVVSTTLTPVVAVARTVPAAIATELAAGGPFATTDEAEQIVGYPLLRPRLSVVLPGDESGIIDVFQEVGLPRVRQGYKLVGNEVYLELTQQPETYPQGELPPGVERPGRTTTRTIGSFEGELWEYEDQISFRFLTGSSIQGVPIQALVVSLGGASIGDVERFVESLAFAESP